MKFSYVMQRGETKNSVFSITGRFTRLGQQFFRGIMFNTVFHPFNFIIML